MSPDTHKNVLRPIWLEGFEFELSVGSDRVLLAHQGSTWPRRICAFYKEGTMRRVIVKSKLDF